MHLGWSPAQSAVIMSRMEGMENRLTALLLEDMVRALEGRVSKLERGGG